MPKKRKKLSEKTSNINEKQLLQASFDLLSHVGKDLAQLWSCSDLLPYLHHSCEEVKW